MHRVCALESDRANFGEPEMAYLAGAHQLGHGADRILDRHPGIEPMQVVQVDRFDSESLQTRIARTQYVLGTPVELACPGPIGIGDEAELGGEHHVRATFADRTADEHFVGMRAVDVGSVEEIESQIERMADRRDALTVVGRAVALTHAHAAEAESGDPRAAATELPSSHTFMRAQPDAAPPSSVPTSTRGPGGGARLPHSGQP